MLSPKYVPKFKNSEYIDTGASTTISSKFTRKVVPKKAKLDCKLIEKSREIATQAFSPMDNYSSGRQSKISDLI